VLIFTGQVRSDKTIHSISNLQSPRAISFCIKGLCFFITNLKEEAILQLIVKLADNLVSKYRGVSNESGNGMKIIHLSMH
jgi:hypothetical protein